MKNIFIYLFTFCILSSSAFSQEKTLVESCIESALKKGKISEDKVKDLLAIQTKITLLKFTRLQYGRLYKDYENEDFFDLESSLLNYIKERNNIEDKIHFFESLKNKKEFLSQILSQYPDLFLRKDENVDPLFSFDENDALLLSLYSSVENKEPKLKKDFFDIVNVVNTNMDAVDQSKLSLQFVYSEIEKMNRLISNFENDLENKVKLLYKKAFCELPKECVDCKGSEKKASTYDLFLALKKIQMNKSLFIPRKDEILMNPEYIEPTQTVHSFFAKPIEEVENKVESSEQKPFSTSNDKNRNTILKSYAIGLSDSTECTHFGIFNKASGKFEVFNKENLEKPEKVFNGLCGALAGDENTQWVDKETHKGSLKTPAGSFILDRYPEGRKIPEIFGEDALLVHSDYIRQDKEQGAITELPVFAVHAIPEGMNDRETEKRYELLKNKTTTRRTNGCLNLGNRAPSKDFESVKRFLGNKCRLYVLPDQSENEFVLVTTGTQKKLEFRPKKPENMSESEFSNLFFKSRKSEKDLKLVIPQMENLSQNESAFKNTIEQPSIRQYLMSQYNFSKEEVAMLMKSAMSLYQTYYSEEKVNQTTQSFFRKQFREYRNALKGRNIKVEIDGVIQTVDLDNVGVKPNSTAVVMIRYLARQLKNTKNLQNIPSLKDTFKNHSHEEIFFSKVITNSLSFDYSESELDLKNQILEKVKKMDVKSVEAKLRIIPRQN